MKPHLLLIAIVSVLAAGCIIPQVQTGNPAEYELPGINNTTIFYLTSSSVQVVENVINATSVSFILGENEMNFRKPVAVDYSGNNVTFNISKETIFGRSYVRFNFNSPFSGFVAFTQSDGQDFTRQLTKNGSVRVVLPVNFTTGSRFLGITEPQPDEITTDSLGREVLIWKNPYPEYERISVKYYHKSAQTALLYMFFFLFTVALALWGYYRLSMRALKRKREMMEKGMR